MDFLKGWAVGFKDVLNSSFVNAAKGGTGSDFFAHCISERLDLRKVDILFVEFCVNDILGSEWQPSYKKGVAVPFEELIRVIWRTNPFVHIVVVNLPGGWPGIFSCE